MSDMPSLPKLAFAPMGGMQNMSGGSYGAPGGSMIRRSPRYMQSYPYQAQLKFQPNPFQAGQPKAVSATPAGIQQTQQAQQLQPKMGESSFAAAFFARLESEGRTLDEMVSAIKEASSFGGAEVEAELVAALEKFATGNPLRPSNVLRASAGWLKNRVSNTATHAVKDFGTGALGGATQGVVGGNYNEKPNESPVNLGNMAQNAIVGGVTNVAARAGFGNAAGNAARNFSRRVGTSSSGGAAAGQTAYQLGLGPFGGADVALRYMNRPGPDGKPNPVPGEMYQNSAGYMMRGGANIGLAAGLSHSAQQAMGNSRVGRFFGGGSPAPLVAAAPAAEAATSAAAQAAPGFIRRAVVPTAAAVGAGIGTGIGAHKVVTTPELAGKTLGYAVNTIHDVAPGLTNNAAENILPAMINRFGGGGAGDGAGGEGGVGKALQYGSQFYNTLNSSARQDLTNSLYNSVSNDPRFSNLAGMLGHVNTAAGFVSGLPGRLGLTSDMWQNNKGWLAPALQSAAGAAGGYLLGGRGGALTGAVAAPLAAQGIQALAPNTFGNPTILNQLKQLKLTGGERETLDANQEDLTDKVMPLPEV